MPAGWNLLNPFGEVSIIDVGQGDSILIHLPFGQGNYLIDTGGRLQFPAEPWQKLLKPLNWRRCGCPFFERKRNHPGLIN